MDIIPIPYSISPVQAQSQNVSPIETTKKTFSDFITSSIDEVNKAQVEGDLAIEKLNSGEAQNLHDVMIAVEQADLSLRMLVQVRNKALSAYDEIMRMQI